MTDSDSSNVLLVEHPVVADRLTRLRDRKTPADSFRQTVSELSALIAYEALRGLGVGTTRIDTPIASDIEATRVTETVLLVPVLRAGLGMIPAIQALLPQSDVAHIGLRRNEVTLEPEVYLNRLPAHLAGRRVVVCDPMLATGGSLAGACSLVKAHGATQVMALCLIASRPGLSRFHSSHADVLVACAAIDTELNGNGYIVPGLGDAGDRLFGPPD
jgi:uracil phosphoribosyltransferase